MRAHPQCNRLLPSRHKIRNQILAWQNQGERTRPKFVRETNGQCIWSSQAVEPLGIRKMDNQWITQGPFFCFENSGTSQGIESGRTKSIHGFRGQRDQLSGGEKLGGWLKSLGSGENPGLQASNSLSSAS